MMPGMADRDPAFLWETEALRAPAASTPAGPSRSDRPATTDWLSLRQASDATGIPVSTLRNWARKGRIPTSLDETPSGTRRMVSLNGVRARARQLGQTAQPVAGTRERAAAGGTEPQAPVPADPMSPPPGTMLVPIDAWDKMLLQLGNLHQAGQQLAEARERAARAETEAAFLRERLAELRETSPAPVGTSAGTPGGDEPSTESTEQPAKPARIPSFTAYLWRMAVSDRRRK
jgi:DNA-binding transcriptional MerR regulator